MFLFEELKPFKQENQNVLLANSVQDSFCSFHPCYSESYPQTSSTSILWELVGDAGSQTHSKPTESESALSQDHTVCKLKSENQCTNDCTLLSFTASVNKVALILP